MKSGKAWFSLGLAASVGLWACAHPAYAQNRQASDRTQSLRSVHFRSQYIAVNELASQLGPEAADVEKLYQLSRLLSDPCDQLKWLSEQLDRIEVSGTEARQAAQRVFDRLNLMQSRDAALFADCSESLSLLIEVVSRMATQAKPWEIADPVQLAETWSALTPAEKNELAPELTPERRLLLNARGIPARELSLTGRDSWDVPRDIVDRLAASAELPAMTYLLRLHDKLERAAADAASWNAIQFPVRDEYLVARALLDRALGIDAADRQDNNRSPDWSAIAASFESADMWSWATLAGILQMAAGESASATTNPAAAWQKVSQVMDALNKPAWPAVQRGDNSWFSRMSNDSPADRDKPGFLPLSAEYRFARRARRQEFEQRFLQARNQNNLDDAFKNIQLAKAVDAGLDPATYQSVTLAELENLLADMRGSEHVGSKILALAEILAIHNPSTGTYQYHGLLMNVAGWTYPGTQYDNKLVGPVSSPEQLFRDGFGENYKQNQELRLLIAFDGPFTDGWFRFESDLWKWATADPGWILYMPSLTAYAQKPSSPTKNWNMDAALRRFFLSALEAGNTLGVLASNADSNPKAAPRPIDPIHENPSPNQYAFSIGEFPRSLATSRNLLSQIKSTLSTQYDNASAPPAEALHVLLVDVGSK